MKKIIVFLLALLLLLCACGDTTDNDAPDVPPEVPPYEKIQRRKSSGFTENHYTFQQDNVMLTLSLPSEWVLSKTDDGFDILRDDEIVGSLLAAPANDTADWTVLKTDTHSENNVSATQYIEQKNGQEVFRYRYVYSYLADGNARTVTLTAACAEIDKACETNLLTKAAVASKMEVDTIGALSSLGDPSSFLILGNSFIGTSNIGNILSEMLQNGEKNCTVRAISTGNATVETYANNASLLASIRNGTYDAVFICGLYNDSQVDRLGVLKEACDASATTLVIFPAHNESKVFSTSAQSIYPTLFCLDWREEINSLIGGGVDRWDLCINDGPKHSTPLAGYVGAHMIYRAIYNELPTNPMQFAMNQSDIDEILGNYAYTGQWSDYAEECVVYLD